MEDDKSTTPGNNPNDDITAGDTTVTDSTQTGTDNQPGESQQPGASSKSTDTDGAAGGDKSTDDTTKTDDAPASKFDDDLADWVEKRGLKKPETDAEKQAYQDLRNSQREFTRSRQDNQAKKDAEELNKAVNDAKPTKTQDDDDDDRDPLEKRMDAADERFESERTARLQSEFFVDNKVTSEQGKAIVDIMREKFNAPASPEGKQRAFELWSHPDALPDLLDLAKARLGQADASRIADEAAQQEREKIERESNAKSPGRSASQHVSTGNDDPMSDEARRKRFEARYNKS